MFASLISDIFYLSLNQIELTMGVKILLILLFVSYVKADAENCNVRGQCTNAQISHLITASTPLKCLENCLAFDDCKWYTFKNYEEERNCELFKTCGSVVNDCNGCISGQNTCPTDNCETKGFCLGTVITSVDVYTRYSCDASCKNEPGCKYYSFSSKSGNCYFFEDCPSIDETVVEFESSKVGCPLVF